MKKYDIEKEFHKKLDSLLEQGKTDKKELVQKLSKEFYVSDMQARRYINTYTKQMQLKVQVLT